MSEAKAIFAAGCFWGVQSAFDRMPGILSTRVGYIGGRTDHPSYQQVCYEDTGHAEAVEVTFDPARITYERLVQAFFELHDPTTPNRQGPDVGAQYRSAIFYADAAQKAEAQRIVAELSAARRFRRPIVTEIVPAPTFWPAEEYHQKYHEKNGGHCVI